ncbi:hypothetical protein [Reichenbachiella sp.]|uniref:hypothetical protein n=1 Tax=Reichenbachiella sp. TaxID=2184521 RepID=UPI003B5CCEDD
MSEIISKCEGQIQDRKCKLRDNCKRYAVRNGSDHPNWLMPPNASVNGRCNLYIYNGNPLYHDPQNG